MATTTVLTGKVFDGLVRKMGGELEGIPSPKIEITDRNGKLYQKYRVMGDIDGNFTLEIPSIIKRGKYITASNSMDRVTVPLVVNKNNYNIDMGIQVQNTQDEVTVTADPEQVKCIRAKGKWDSSTKTCTLPQEPKKNEPKKKMSTTIKILIGIGVLIVVGGTVYLATRKRKG